MRNVTFGEHIERVRMLEQAHFTITQDAPSPSQTWINVIVNQLGAVPDGQQLAFLTAGLPSSGARPLPSAKTTDVTHVATGT